jgi:hypothetical protein
MNPAVIVKRGDPRRLLSTVLKCKQTVMNQPRREVWRRPNWKPDRYDPALLLGLGAQGVLRARDGKM